MSGSDRDPSEDDTYRGGELVLEQCEPDLPDEPMDPDAALPLGPMREAIVDLRERDEEQTVKEDRARGRATRAYGFCGLDSPGWAGKGRSGILSVFWIAAINHLPDCLVRTSV
jgi:hypothetical protein